jgi:hypothetical protein
MSCKPHQRVPEDNLVHPVILSKFPLCALRVLCGELP